MKGKDEIKELFQKELGNYEAKVDPSLWNGIQSGLTGSAAATGGSAAGLSVATKAVIGVVIATAAIISSIVIFSTEEIKKEKQVKVESSAKIQDSIKNISEDPVISESIEESNTTQKQSSTEPATTEPTKNENNIETEVEIVEVPEIVEVYKEETHNDKVQEKDDPIESSSSSEDNEDKVNEKETELDYPIVADISILKQDNQYVKFDLNGENIERVEWYFGDGRTSNKLSPDHFYEEPGSFDVIAIVYGENGMSIEKTININVNIEGEFTKLPNTFTPNNDGINDEFYVEHEGISELQLNIFNKKQELIFSTNNPRFRWRGYDSKGEKAPNGEYIYVIIAKDKAGNVINKYKTLTINR